MSKAVCFVCALWMIGASGVPIMGCGDSANYKDRIFGVAPEEDAGLPDGAGTGGSAGRSMGQAGAGAREAPDVLCVPAVAADHLRPRSTVMESAASGSGASQVFTRDLFNLFRSNCGACHVDGSSGNLHVGLHDFHEKIGAEALERITSDDPKYFMPPAESPAGKPFSKREPEDPVVELAMLLEAWLAAGRPTDAFTPSTTADGSAPSSQYLLPESVAMQMTNIGSCVPDKRMFAEAPTEADDLDKMFEAATELPERLEQTDLVTYDSEALARRGVIAFAPAYTLWADNAKKIRLVRLPRGKSIEFDRETQTFTIPPNTRFYKTFLKRVIDIEGNESYRKMETRLILSRPDEVSPDGTTRRATALFGTYAWNEQETEAVLVRDPLRNGEPFRDRLVTYIKDEQAAEKVIDSLSGSYDLLAEFEEAGITRTYAIPGRERCMHCHMGSPGGSFVLGFTPLQINRRPMGEGGVIEPADRDELNQIQRLIDYGVITGMTSAEDIVPLEDSQGERKPRNEHELEAQGYMLGNCAHCHNPHGFPSVVAPELRDVLNFMPGPDSGIFQFPLDKFSPRIFRGEHQEHKIAYITPSLFDLKIVDADGLEPMKYPGGFSTAMVTPTPKFVRVPTAKGNVSGEYLLAPWRSLIYRNVDTPFSYADDSTIFPHMPRDTPGYDCRARQLLGTWMVSIPARLYRDDLDPHIVDYGRDVQKYASAYALTSSSPADAVLDLETSEAFVTALDPQPYVEVKPDDPEYVQAERAAKFRVRDFKKGRYADCPAESLDIVDPAIVRGVAQVPRSQLVTKGSVGTDLIVPERAHWAVTDLTNPPGDWYPRRADWYEVLIEQQPDLIRSFERPVIELLESVKVSDNAPLRELALTDMPFGLWADKDGCEFPGVRTVADFAGNRPAWMEAGGHAQDSSHVYEISPGAQVFTTICRHCHGPEADARGRLADTIADMTGGETRVGNLRDGILGPIGDPGANRERVFGRAAGNGLTADDWAARYLVWMGLGGTQRLIPQVALSLVNNSDVLGEQRGGRRSLPAGSANMLTIAQFLCGEVLPDFRKNFDVVHGTIVTPLTSDAIADVSALNYKNGDAEMWERLCTLDNARPVRVVDVRYYVSNDGAESLMFQLPFVRDGDTVVTPTLYRRSAYPGGVPVGDGAGNIDSALDAENGAPWCIRRPADPDAVAAFERFWTEERSQGSEPPPYCPEAFLAESNILTLDEINGWTKRGAMNAGLSVFLYLDALARGEKQRVPEYNHCEDLHAE